MPSAQGVGGSWNGVRRARGPSFRMQLRHAVTSKSSKPAALIELRSSPQATSMPSNAMSTSPGSRWPCAKEMGCTERTSTPFWSSPILKCFL